MSPLINLLHLKFFYDAVTHKSISHAAKVNFVTQSAVSQGILKLTKIIGADLIYHNKQGLQITAEGKVVFENADHIFKAINNTFDQVRKINNDGKTEVKFVTTKSVGLFFFSNFHKKTLQEISLDLQFKVGGLEFIRNSLRKGDAEFAVAVVDNGFDEFERKILHRGFFHLYQAKQTSDHLIEKGILIDYAESPHVKELCKTLNLSIQMELSGWENVARFTEIGMGVGFLPDYLVDGPRYASLEISSVKTPVYEYEISVVYVKGKELSRGARVFLDQFLQ